MADARPTVAVYEPDAEGVEQLVHRPMNDDEFAVWENDRDTFVAMQAADEEAAGKNPLVAQVEAMSDEERAQLRDLLGED